MKARPPRSLDTVLMRLVRSRLFIPLLIVSLAAIAVAGFFGVQVLEDRQQEIVQSRAAMIDRYIDQSDHMLGAVVQVARQSSPDEIRTSMQATYDAYGNFDTIYLLDNQSRIEQMVPPDVRYLGMDMSGIPAGTLTGSQGGFRISHPFISLRTGKPTVYIARDLPSGGSVVGELSLDTLQQEITASPGRPQGDFIFIMDQHGTLIAHPSHDLVLQQTNMGDLMIFRQIMDGLVTRIYPYEGTPVLGSAARVDRTGWVVVDQVPVAVAFGTYAVILGLSLIVLTGIWIIVAWSLSARLRSEIVIPLEHLSHGASALAAGDFDAGIQSLPPAGTFVELDQLADDFRQMNSAIQERQRALEQNRDELLRKNEELGAAYEHLAANEEELRSNYDSLSAKERELEQSREELVRKNSELQAAYERLKADEENLQKKIDELERFARVVTNRELKMIELKEKIRQLEQERTAREEKL